MAQEAVFAAEVNWAAFDTAKLSDTVAKWTAKKARRCCPPAAVCRACLPLHALLPALLPAAACCCLLLPAAASACCFAAAVR